MPVERGRGYDKALRDIIRSARRELGREDGRTNVRSPEPGDKVDPDILGIIRNARKKLSESGRTNVPARQ